MASGWGDDGIVLPIWEPTAAERKVFEEWKRNTVQHLVNYKSGIPPNRLPAQLEDRFDERIPLEKMGFRDWSINQFLYQMGNEIEVRKVEGRLYIYVRESAIPEHLSHIREMVLGQRNDREGVTRHAGTYVRCNELLRRGFGRRPPLQPSSGTGYNNRMNISTQRSGPNNRNYGRGPPVRRNNYSQPPRFQTSGNGNIAPRSNGYGRVELNQHLKKKSSYAVVPKPRVAHFDEEDWDMCCPALPTNTRDTSKIMYSGPPPVTTTTALPLPTLRLEDTNDELNGVDPMFLPNTKENTPPASQLAGPSPKQPLGKLIARGEALSKAIEKLKLGKNKTTGQDPTVSVSPLAVSPSVDVSSPKIEYGYSIDTDMGLDYPYSTVILSASAGEEMEESEETALRIYPSFKPVFQFPPYLVQGSKSFKTYMQENGTLGKFMNAITKLAPVR